MYNYVNMYFAPKPDHVHIWGISNDHYKMEDRLISTHIVPFLEMSTRIY